MPANPPAQGRVRDRAEDSDTERAAHRAAEHERARDHATAFPFDRRLRSDQCRARHESHAQADHEAGRSHLPYRASAMTVRSAALNRS